MTSVVGLDIGNLASKIGVARNRGIDVITNEVSNRATPSLISFGPRSRSIGESAKTLETSNFRNTIGSLKRLIGRTINDPEVEYERQFTNVEFADVNGLAGVKVQYLGETAEFNATQLYGMYLGKLRDTILAETKAPVNDVVIAVPGWYNDQQRRAVYDAAEIAGLNALRLINDTTATALGYGISKDNLPEKDAASRHVVFADIGHSDYSVAVVAYNKGQLIVKSTAYDRHFGGREFDKALVDHFAEEFKGKYKIDVKSNPKAVFRLATNVEKLKKILSANANATINVESIMEDIDASSSLNRESFEALIAPLLDRTTNILEQALADAGMKKEDIDAIELVGGSSRIPAIKQRIADYFGKGLSFTCNQDEAIARGATFSCASLSPVFRARPFDITDAVHYPIEVRWEATPENQDDSTSILAFSKGNSMPSTKMLTFYRKQDFDVEAHYVRPESGESGILSGNTFISRFTVKGVKPTAQNDDSQIRLNVRMNPSGVLEFVKPHLLKLEEVEAPATEEKDANMEADKAAAEGETNGDATPAEGAEATKKTVKKTKIELNGIGFSTAAEASALSQWREEEGKMHSSDKLIAETDERKNALEEYIYDVREKLDGTWASFSTAAEKEELKAKAMSTEDWLYSEEGEDARKSDYVGKLDELLAIGNKIKQRSKEYDERPAAERSLRQAIANYSRVAENEDYSHLTEEELQKVIEKTANAEKWLSDIVAKQAERRKDENPVVKVDDIIKKLRLLDDEVKPILAKPKPKATPAPTPPPKSGEQTPADKPDVDMKDGEEQAEQPAEKEMDVD